MTTSPSAQQQSANAPLLRKSDRLRLWWRSTFLQANSNFERMHNVGFAYAMVPLLKRLYPDNKEEQIAEARRHLEFVNTHPYLMSPIFGVVSALEEERASGTKVPDEAIQGVKIGMMGPLAGVGDPVFWGTLRPVLGAFAAALALSHNILGPLIFFLAWNAIRMAFMWYTQELGHRSGLEITRDLSGGVLRKITTGSAILGVFVMGVLVPRWTSMNFPLVLSQVAVDKEATVDVDGVVEQLNSSTLTGDSLRSFLADVQNGLSLTGTKVQTLGDVFDQILPGLMPLMLTFGCIWLLRKKVNPIAIIMGIFVLGIVLHAAGIMG